MKVSVKSVGSMLSLVCVGALAFSASAHAVGGTVSGWGLNDSAQIAPPVSKELTTATPVGGLSDVTQVAAGA